MSTTRNSVTTPAGVIGPILRPTLSTNHMFPSGPAAMPAGPLRALDCFSPRYENMLGERLGVFDKRGSVRHPMQ